jgi:hypothetical protein
MNFVLCVFNTGLNNTSVIIVSVSLIGRGNQCKLEKATNLSQVTEGTSVS